MLVVLHAWSHKSSLYNGGITARIPPVGTPGELMCLGTHCLIILIKKNITFFIT